MKPASLALTACGIGLLVATVLLGSYLIPYRTRFEVSPPAVCTVNVWGHAIQREPAEELISWINREVSTTTITGVSITYRLDFVRVESPGSLQVRFHMCVHGTTPTARNALGPAIAEYHKRVNTAVSTGALRLENGYLSETPLLDKKSDTITTENPLWLTPRR
jgi:hypothetical protein